ncbi:MAG TPA: peptidylprolyl isomerase [Anaeromyxobacteraceae bacterium]|nr:peptidylprolyl isomerase [Anaeromyxobacteraceae bacterium]
MTKPILLALAALAATPALAQAPKADTKKPAPAAAPAAPAAQYAVFETSKGKIGVRLLPKKAPNAVKNFVGLAEGTKGWTDPATGEQKKGERAYDGTLFHRVIPNFMIQGGDLLSRNAPFGATATKTGVPFGTGSPGYQFDDELEAGTAPFDAPCQLAMANSGPNTNGSQFFITEGTPHHLNPKPCDARGGVCGYVHFGEGVCGCELVGQIARAGNDQVRLEKVVITTTPPTCK